METKKLTSSSGSFDYVKDVSIAEASFDRVLPRQVSTGSTRGTQTVGYGGVKIDGSNNRIDLEANDTRTVLGDISDTNDITGLGIYDGDDVLRLLGGKFPDGSVKIKLSQTGKDVSTATDDELIWSSDFNLFKIVDIITVPLSATLSAGSATLASTSVPHGLAFTPAYAAFISIDPAFAALSSVGTTNGPNPFLVFGTSGTDVYIFGVFEVTVDDTNINFAASIGVTGAATYNFSAKVYLLRETIT